MLLEAKGTRVEFGFSFVLVVTLMLLFSDQRIVLLSVLSSLLHECGHLFMMKLFGEKIERIIFGAFGVRIEKLSFSSLSYKKEIAVSLGGIIANFILFLISFIIYIIFHLHSALIFAIINVLIAFMNSLPLKSLDMGRVIKLFLMMKFGEERTQKITSLISLIFFLVFSAFTALYCAFINVNFSLIAVAIYLLTETELKIHGQ